MREQYSHLIRIALSGHADMEMILESVKATHQFLAKPCDADSLKATIDRAITLSGYLENPELKQVIGDIDALPSLPGAYNEIMSEVSSPQGNLANVGEIISRDLAMTAKILQLVNSAFFGLPSHISSPAQATTLLGLDVIRGLVLSLKVFSEMDPGKAVLDVESLLSKSTEVGSLAKRIAACAGLDRKYCDHAMMAGLLHDIGQVVLANKFPEKYKQVTETVRERSIPTHEAELEVFSSTHAAVGAYLLGLWGLPNTIVEAVAFHHNPALANNTGLTPLSAVYIAETLLYRKPAQVEDLSDADRAYFDQLGVIDSIPQWIELCNEDFEND